MAEETKNVVEHEVPKVATEESSAATGEVTVTDRGLFDFLGKNKEEESKPEETIESEFEHKVQISEPAPMIKHEEEDEEEKKPSLLEKLHRNDSSSSSSSDEEEGEDGEKRKKKKEKKKTSSTEEEVKTEEEKKGFMEKLKEKLPGYGKKPEDASATATATAEPVVPPVEEAHPAEKKGIFEKIKEKLPGYNSKTVEEEKKEKESD